MEISIIGEIQIKNGLTTNVDSIDISGNTNRKVIDKISEKLRSLSISKENAIEDEDIITYQIDLPDKYNKFFEYIKTYFPLTIKQYLEFIIIREIESRNTELHFF